MSNIFTTKVMSIKFLLSMNIKNPDFQRYLEPERVELIMEDIKQRGYVLGCITLCKFSGTNEYLCLDGQHRYQAILNLYNNYPKLKITTQIIIVNTEEEVKSLFFNINQSKPVPLPESYLSIDKPKEVVNRLKSMFPDIIKNNSNRRRPYINENDLLLIVSKMTGSIEEIVASVLDFNQTILNTESKLLKKRKDDTINKIEEWKDELKQKGGFYIGLYPNDYNDNIIIDGNIRNNSIEKKKVQHLRKMVWENCIEGKVYDSNCPACNCNIDIFSYEISHNIPKSKGGSDDLDNLRVLCGTCNRRSNNRYTVDEWINLLNK